MPVGQVVTVGWYFLPAVPVSFPMLPGGMLCTPNGIFGMIVAGWVAFTGTPPI